MFELFHLINCNDFNLKHFDEHQKIQHWSHFIGVKFGLSYLCFRDSSLLFNVLKRKGSLSDAVAADFYWNSNEYWYKFVICQFLVEWFVDSVRLAKTCWYFSQTSNVILFPRKRMCSKAILVAVQVNVNFACRKTLPIFIRRNG